MTHIPTTYATSDILSRAYRAGYAAGAEAARYTVPRIRDAVATYEYDSIADDAADDADAEASA